MNCPNCETSMETVTAVEDCLNPANFHGHSQAEFEVMECPKCEEQMEVN